MALAAMPLTPYAHPMTMKATPTQTHQVVPDYLYRIAIDGLPVETECLREGGIYLINVDEWDDCTLLAKQLLARNQSHQRGVLVTTHNASDSIKRLQESLTVTDFEALRFIGANLTALKALTSDLDSSVRPYQRTILLLLPANVTTQIAPHWRDLLSRWQSWLHGNDCALLILAVTPESDLNHQDMLANNDLLNGLATLERASATEFIYHCAYWRSVLGVAAARKMQLSQRSGYLRVHALDAAPTLSFTAKRRHNSLFVIEEAALKDFGYVKEDGWIIAKSHQALYERARKNVDITAVFALSNYRQLPEIARLVHALRIERGPVIRLIVRELSTQLRLQDEQTLLDCGANLILGGSLSYTRFKSLLENLQTLRYTRPLSPVPESFSVSTETHATDQNRPSAVAPEEFLLHCHDKIHGPDQLTSHESVGVLVCLQPVPGLTASQVASQLVLRRYEDAATYLDNDIYLFLFGCPPELVISVLRQLFRLPVEEIFINQTRFEDTVSIQGELQRLAIRASQHELQAEEPTPGDTDQEPVAEFEALRYTPQRVGLVLS